MSRLLLEQFGRTEESLLGSGLLDSVRAIEFSLHLEQEFAIRPGKLALQDMVSLTGLVSRIAELVGNTTPGEPIKSSAA